MTINISLSNLANLQNETTAISTINANSATIAGGFTTALNTTGDQMQGTLDMNSNQIINLPSPGTANSPMRLQDFTYIQGGGTVIFPTILGGTNISVPASTTGTYTVSTITGPVFTTVSTTTLTVHNAITASTITATTINGSVGKFSTITISNSQPIYFSNSAGAADAALLEGVGGGLVFKMGSANSYQITDSVQNQVSVFQGVGNAGPYFVVTGGTTALLSQVNVLASLSSSSISTGSLTVAGGLGVIGQINAGATVSSPTVSATTLIISGNANVGTITTGVWNATAITTVGPLSSLTVTTFTVSGTTNMASVTTTNPIVLPKYTVTSLPSGVTGMIAMVTDALAPTFLGTLTGGGTTKSLVSYNGSAWVAS
jgi:hypothetical protein